MRFVRSAASADRRGLRIQPVVFLLDPLGEGTFLGLNAIGPSDIVLARWQIEKRIVLRGVLCIERLTAGAFGVLPGRLPMADRSLPSGVAGRPFRPLARL